MVPGVTEGRDLSDDQLKSASEDGRTDHAAQRGFHVDVHG